MIALSGIAVVLVAVMVGFSMAGGHLHSLIHPSEIVTIGGAALGALIASSPKKVLIDLVHGLIGVFKGDKCDRRTHVEVFGLLYELFQIARRDGILAWESIVAEIHTNPLIAKYPRVAQDHHLVEFLAGALAQGIDGADVAQVESLLETEINVHSVEHHAAVAALTRTADALPGFGIVAAVLGIVVTMGAIDGPVEVIGEKVGAALVGTFLGILLSYGVIGPVAGRMEAQGDAETALLRTVAKAVTGFIGGTSARAVLETTRRGVASDRRPTQQDMEEIFKAPTA